MTKSAFEYPNLRVTAGVHSVADGDVTNEIFTLLAVEHGLTHGDKDSWKTKDDRLELDTKFSIVSSFKHRAVFWIDDVLVRTNKTADEIKVTVLARTAKECHDAREKLKKLLPEDDTESRHQVKINFWYYDVNHGGDSYTRHIAVPSFDQLSSNYSDKVSNKIQRLVESDFHLEDAGGRLVIWHGAPGTGKTHAIRALAWEWHNIAGINYITDPERFFDHPDYMLNVMIGNDETWDNEADDYVRDDKWRLLIVEDAGELISIDAKQKKGQGLSRLLNTVDGLIGQGLKVIVLITTNEPIAKFDPAIARKGRTLSNIEFEELTEEETIKWLRENNVDVEEVPKDRTLAWLYALKNGEVYDDESRDTIRVGF